MQVENTRTPPIQLKHHFFSIINVVARQDIQSENQSIETGDAFRFDVGVGEIPQHEEDPTYQVSLRIRSQENSEQPLPYEIDLETIGFVTVSQDCPQEKAFGYVQVLGPTLLFGAAREFLYSLTLRGPWPPIYLPTISFLPQEPENGSATLE